MRERGSTLLEVLVATALMVALLSAITTLLHDGLAATPLLEERADLQQRGRVSLEAIASDLRLVGVGTRADPLSATVAAVLPRAAAAVATAASADVLTVRYAPANAPESTLREPLAPAGQEASIESAAGCPRSTVACGFTAGTSALLVGQDGQTDILAIDAVASGVLTVRDVDVARTVTYPAGTGIVALTEVTYTLDVPSRQLRRREGAGTFALADQATELTFEYFDHAFGPIPLASLVDGPFRGTGRMSFDTDLLRIRTVRASIRLETAVTALRGTDAQLFRRPGTATGWRNIPDLVATLDVAVRNGRR